ncbi:hypothetical protein VT84_33670 [Gemmata sp. SH-PL17]|uniref:hypothetical protein n=1 Tax=Gemmata sp. SH-PL17 TaxID=1630693 RepID=UPI00078D3B6C|nr:hypothetical protein [Gemmata sp. SH-PL17]AMV29392.1 hypothetical protein VT84_33670 [Gemmata sp. SH-PL17]
MQSVMVLQSERAAGLDRVIRSNTRVVLASVARVGGPTGAPQSVTGRFATGAVSDSDLHHLSTVLVTVGWNRNDDVFDRAETWAARHTPTDKQLNYEHDDRQIVGHVTANHVTDTEGRTIPDDTSPGNLPAKFHLVTAGVLYKHWQTPELQARMDALIAEIAQGKWFVSMECRFAGFDYCLKDASGGARVVARNEGTAFLSKHLRAYGGSGRYGEKRVGRVLRNIVFTGKGLVRNPANPESVILAPVAGTASAAVGSVIATWLLDRAAAGRSAVPTVVPLSPPCNRTRRSTIQADIDQCFGVG